DVGFARPIIAALHRVVEEAVDAIAVVLIILRRVDAALRRDRMRAPRAVLDAEVQDVVTELAERGRRRRARQAGADDDDRVLPFVRRVDQLHLELVAIPLSGDRPGRHSCVELHDRTPAKWAQRAMTMNPPAINTAITFP